MASTKAAAKTAAKPAKTGTAVVKWDEALAAKAKAAHKVAATVSSGGGNYLSFKGGRLSYKDAHIKSNEIDVVVLSAVAENDFFEGAYDSKKPQSPLCYAFGRPDGDDDMKPHEQVFKDGNNQSDLCKTCEHNQWGSAEKGRGKACKNQVKLALITAESLEKDDGVKKEEVFYAKLPVTSGKHWARYVNELDAKHYLQFVTTLRVVPDDDDQFHVEFEAKEEITGEILGALVERSDKEEKNMAAPYPKFDEPPARSSARPTGKRVIPVKKAAASKPRKY